MDLAEAQTVVAGMTGYVGWHPDTPGEVTLDRLNSRFTLRELTAITVVLQAAVDNVQKSS